MPSYRRGVAAIKEAAESRGGGNFRPFVPEISWREDGESKYILVLTPIDEVATLRLHEWIPVATREKANGETYVQYEAFLSRRDPLVDEDSDDLEDRLDRKPKDRCVGVGVELEPVMETVRGRQRPKGFSVKTSTFTRKTDDGEQEVTQPEIGLISQSSSLMWSPLASYDESQGPLDALPLQIVRRGVNKNTRYDFVPFMDAPVDLSGVVQYLDGVSYLSEDLDDVTAAIDATSDEVQAAQVVAMALLDRRIRELADPDRYEELVTPITEIKSKYGADTKAQNRPSRPARRSPREAQEEAPQPVVEEQSKEEQWAKLKARFDK